MKRVIVLAAVLGLVVGVAPAAAHMSGQRHAPVLRVLDFQPRSSVSTAEAMKQAKAAKTVKMWRGSVTDGGNFHRFSMIGQNPTTPELHQSTAIRTYLVNVTVINNGTDVFSPTDPDPCDKPDESPETRVLDSPIF